MSSEEKLLNEIFGVPDKLWKGRYKIYYCDLCETFSISCPDCKASSCNCSSCDKCSADIDEFHKTVKARITNYLTKEEQNTFAKIRILKKWMERSLNDGEPEINWKKIHEEGWAAPMDYELFDELKQFKDK